MKYGIDVSFHRGYPDWNRVRGKIDFAILAVTELYNGIDETFEHNYWGCAENGIPVGVYTYSYAKNGADSRRYAKLVLDQIKDKQIDLPVFLDMEWKTQITYSQATRNDIITQFKDEIEKAGYEFGLYVNKEWYYNYIPDFVKSCPIWLGWPATTGNTCPENLKPNIPNLICWQYSWTGHIDGIEGNELDMDIWYGNFKEKPVVIIPSDSDEPMLSYGSTGEAVRKLQEALNQRGFALDVDGDFGPLTEAAVMSYQERKHLKVDGIVGPMTWAAIANDKTDSELAQEVINGKWGNGEERKQRLSQAGYDYEAVQAEVNRILR